MTSVPVAYLRQGLLSNATTNCALALFLVLAAGLLRTKLGLPAGVLVGAGLTLGAEHRRGLARASA
jgi:hypothetical protein